MKIKRDNVETYFTNAEELRHLFINFIKSKKFPSQILCIHGMAGVGKSSLMAMYHADATSANLSVGQASFDNSQDIIIAGWVKSLRPNGVQFSEYSKVYRAYEKERTSTTEIKTELTQKGTSFAQKVTSKTIEAATAGTMALATTGKLNPEYAIAVASLVSGTVGASTEGFFEYLNERKSKKRTKKLSGDRQKDLTQSFIEDIAKSSEHNRLVLILDAFDYEFAESQNGNLAKMQWLTNLLEKLPSNILVVVAGRYSLKEALSRNNEKFPKEIEEKELKPMTTGTMKELAYRYYQMQEIDQEPDREQINSIIRFSRGLPLAVTTSIKLWVDHGDNNFTITKPDVLKDLSTKLIKGIPDELLTALYAITSLRWFNVEILAALIGKDGAYNKYKQLLPFPFIYKHGIYGSGNTYAVHAALRELINDHLATNADNQHNQLHQAAVNYFAEKLKDLEYRTKPRDREQSILELIYHLLELGEDDKAFYWVQEAIEYATGFHNKSFITSVRSLLEKYAKKTSSRQWSTYINWHITKMDPSISKQQTAWKELVELLNEPNLDQRLRSLVVMALADVPEEAKISTDQRIIWLENAIQSDSLLPSEVAKCYLQLGGVFRERADWKRAEVQFEHALQLYTDKEDPLGMIYAMDGLAYTYLLTGKWQQAIKIAKNAVDLSRLLNGYMLSTTLKTLGWVYTYSGNLQSGLLAIQEAIEIAGQRNAEAEKIRLSRRLAEIYDRKKEWGLSNHLYLEYIEKDRELNRLVSMASFQALLGSSYVRQGQYSEAEKMLLASLENVNLHNIQLVQIGLGQLYLNLERLQDAKYRFEQALAITRERPYYFAQAKLGLLQIYLNTGDIANANIISKEIESLGINNLYFDILAMLYLLLGGSAWNKAELTWQDRINEVFRYYQRAIICALRYNSFLLDDILSGKPLGYPITALIPKCIENDKAGQNILAKIMNWWQAGIKPTESTLLDIGIADGKPINLVIQEQVIRQGNKEQNSVIYQLKKAAAGGK